MKTLLSEVILCFGALLGVSHAQTYPVKPVRIVVAYPAGGSIDLVGRMVGQRLTESMGRQFVIDNRAGAGGNIGTDHVAKSAPDGYTLIMGSAAAFASNPAVYAQMPYSSTRDFAPITLIVIQPNVVIVHPSVPVRSVADLVALARARPDRLTYGSGGVGTSYQMATELFMLFTKTRMTHVPYKGGAPAMTDLLGGQIDLMFEPIPTAIPHVRSNRLRAIAVTTGQRSEILPDVPALREAGLPEYEYRGWVGLLAPAGTPPDLVARLHAEVGKALDAGLATRFRELAFLIANRGPEPFAQFIRDELAMNQRIARAANIRAE